MGTGYLIDTNVIIDYLENKLPEDTSIFLDNLLIQLSVITRIELLVWPKATSHQVSILQDFISASQILWINEDIVLKTIEIRKTYKLKLPDSIIAATALVNDLTLVTRNTTDFKKIDGLICIDPYKLK